MHRSSFRAPKFAGQVRQERVQPVVPPLKGELDGLREQIENISRRLVPLTSSVARLAAPREDVSIPADVAQSLKLVHGRLDRLERELAEAESSRKKMAATFSNAILKMGDKVEKIAGVEDSSFSLAHSLEKLLKVLSSRKLRIIRDSNGDMVAVETEIQAGN